MPQPEAEKIPEPTTRYLVILENKDGTYEVYKYETYNEAFSDFQKWKKPVMASCSPFMAKRLKVK
jgi:hypothetical protein